MRGSQLDPFFMSFEFQSTLVNITPTFRISGSQIGGIRIEDNGGIRVARVIVTNDADIKFALTGPYESGDPDAIYAALSSELHEVAEGVLLNEGAISSIERTDEMIVIDLKGSDRKFAFMPSADVVAPVEVSDHTWKITEDGFAVLMTVSAAWRSSMDGTLEGLAESVAQEVADRIAAITAEEQRVDALIASGMWLFDDQASFPDATTNHGRVVHSHADGAIFYAHGGMWHQVAKEVDLQTTIDSVANEAATREAADTALSGRLDVLEADPTTATAVAAGDSATLSSANSYTDTAVAGVQADVDQNESDSDAADAALSGRLDVLEADPTTATAVAAVQADVDQNESDGDAADAALSARLDVLEADPTTATAVAAVQSDVDQNEADADAAIAGEATSRANADTALSGRLDVLEADPTTATAVAAVQSDVDQNESDSDAADAALSARIDVLEADPTTQTLLDAEAAARVAGDAAASTYTDTQISNLIGAAPTVLNTLEEIANSINDDSDVYTNIVSQIVAGDTAEATTRAAADTAIQADVDQNEADSDAADAALSARLDVLEADPTTATAVAAVQSDVDQNEADADAADAALSGRLDVLEADPTTATALAAVQADVDQNETDSDAADAALSARLDVLEADPATATAVAANTSDIADIRSVTGTLDGSTHLGNFSGAIITDGIAIKTALQELSNAIEATQTDVDGNEADADTADALRALLDGSNIPGPYANDAAAATGGVAVGAIYKHDNGQIHYRVS